MRKHSERRRVAVLITAETQGGLGQRLACRINVSTGIGNFSEATASVQR